MTNDKSSINLIPYSVSVNGNMLEYAVPTTALGALPEIISEEGCFMDFDMRSGVYSETLMYRSKNRAQQAKDILIKHLEVRRNLEWIYKCL